MQIEQKKTEKDCSENSNKKNKNKNKNSKLIIKIVLETRIKMANTKII